MYKTKRVLLLAALFFLALAACGGDNKDHHGGNDESTPTPESGGTVPNLNTGPGLGIQAGGSTSGSSSLPGCSDPNDNECPVPLVLDLDGEASAGGVTIRYPTRYFAAATREDGDILIEITPSENNKFPEKATFQVYFAGSVDAALAGLVDPVTAEWTTDTLNGTIGVMKDQTLDPPVNTTIGAFLLGDGRTVVFEVITTGKYGWDLYARLYEDMLNTLLVSE
jgi:hypothetical protein